MKLKLQEEYSLLNLNLCVTYHMSYIFLCLLLILLVSILFSASNQFVYYFRLLKFTLTKNRLNTIYGGDNIQQERLAVSLEIGRRYFF